jgi:hypothetical protein
VSSVCRTVAGPGGGDVRWRPAHFEPQRFAGQPLERLRLSRRRPELQLRIARRAQLQEVVVAAIAERHTGDRLRVAPIEALCEPQHRGQRAHPAALAALEIAEAVVRAFRSRLAVVARDERDCLDLVRVEAAEIAVLDQIVGMLVMLLVADERADVVQQRGVFQPFALAIAEPVDGARLVEQGHRDPRDLMRVLRPVVTPLGELVHAAAADVGIAVGLRDFLPVPGDVVEHDAFAQRQIAQRDVVRAEPAQHFVEQNHAGHDQVGASRFQPRHAHPVVEVEREQHLARTADLLGGDAPVAKRRPEREAFGRRHDGADAHDRSRRADHAIETAARDLSEKFGDLIVDVAHEFPLVAPLERIALDEALREPDHSQFEAPAELDVRARPARHLHAAAADVDDDRGIRQAADSIDRSQMNQPRLLRPGNHPGPDAGLVGDGLEEFAAVLGLPDGARRHGDNVFDTMGFGQTPEF